MPVNVSKQWNIQLDSVLRAVPREPLQDLNITLPLSSFQRGGKEKGSRLGVRRARFLAQAFLEVLWRTGTKGLGHDSRVKGRSIKMMHGYGTPWMAHRKLLYQLYAGYKLAAQINFSLTPCSCWVSTDLQLSWQSILSRDKKEWIGRIRWLNSKTAAVSTSQSSKRLWTKTCRGADLVCSLEISRFCS